MKPIISKLVVAAAVLFTLAACNDNMGSTDSRLDATNGLIEPIDEKASATVLTTDANGRAAFSGIAPGTYFLEETQAPDGYNPLKGDKEVNVKEETSTEKLTLTPENVANITGTELPETGGIGTTVFYLLGAILVVGAGVVFVTRRRMHAEK